MRFMDPVGFLTIAAFFLPLAGFMAERGVPPLVLIGDHPLADPRLLVQLPEHLDRDDRRDLEKQRVHRCGPLQAGIGVFRRHDRRALDRRGLLARRWNPLKECVESSCRC